MGGLRIAYFAKGGVLRETQIEEHKWKGIQIVLSSIVSSSTNQPTLDYGTSDAIFTITEKRIKGIDSPKE